MTQDPAYQKICDGLSGLKTEIKLLAAQIEGLSKCKNDHEERIRDMEITCISRTEFSKIIEFVQTISSDVNSLKTDSKISNIKFGIIMFIASLLGSGIVMFTVQLLIKHITV